MVFVLSAAVGALCVLVLFQSLRVRAMDGDISTLWTEVFGVEADEPDPGDQADVEDAPNVVHLKGRAA